MFIAGGAQVYAQALPLADRIYLTLVHAVLEADTFFRYILEPPFTRILKDHVGTKIICNIDILETIIIEICMR